MGNVDWTKFCHANLTIWDDGDFGHCFEHLVIEIPTHLLLAIISLYHFFKHRNRRVLGVIPRSPTLHTRFTLTLALMLAPILLLLLVVIYKEERPSPIDILSWGIRALTWFLHSSYVWRLQRLYHIHIRGSLSIIISFLLTTASTIIHLRTIIRHIVEGISMDSLKEYMTFVVGGLHAVYIATLIPWKRPALRELSSAYQSINESTEREVHARFRGYGSIEIPEESLGKAEDTASCLSKLLFWWVNPMMLKGYKGNIKSSEDLFKMPEKLNTQALDNNFSVNFKTGPTQDSLSRNVGRSDINDASLNNLNPEVSVLSHHRRTVLKALNRTFGCEYYSLGILKFIGDGLGFGGPIILNLLVKYMENPGEPTWHGYAYAGGLFLATILGAFISAHFSYRISVVGLKIRAALITTIYRKSLGISLSSMSKATTGEIVNHMSTDTDRIVNFCPTFHSFWSLPAQTAVCLYLLYSQIGWAFLVGVVFTILLIPINRWIAIKIGQLSTEMMKQKDSRVKVMNEILFGIRVIKMYAWEDHFMGRVGKLREAELKSLKGRKYLDALCVYFWATTPVLISILTFTTYSLMGNQLTAAKVFTSMALFNMLIMPLNAFPWVINGLMESWVSVKRLQKFLQMDELDMDSYYSVLKGDMDDVVDIDNATFTWGEVSVQEEDDLDRSIDSADNQANGLLINAEREDGQEHREATGSQKLENITLNVKRGMLVGVIGKVGSGKSSLLNAVLGEVIKEEGTIAVDDLNTGFGLVSQEPWIQHATLKENILFGNNFYVDKYEEVLDACALTEDLQILRAGDLTEIGDQGITLSGGQKARVALARAVYEDKDLYLLDDPLSAVDAHVAKHLFKRCIMGLLRNKTRILCTHHVNFLKDADHIIVMEEGKIVQTGPPSEILSHVDPSVLRSSTPQSTSQAPDPAATPATDPDGSLGESQGGSQGASQGVPEPGGLTEEEEKDVGTVKLHVYHAYWEAVGGVLAVAILIALLLMQASRNTTDWWLSYWVTHSHSSHQNLTVHRHYSADALYTTPLSTTIPWTNMTYADDNIRFYLTIYGSLAAGNSVFTFARAFLYAYGGIVAARKVHNLLLGSILKAPVSFFDMTPIGRILNRFSSDMYAVDDSLPFIMNILFAQSYGLLGTLAITCLGLPWFALILLPLGVVYYFIQRYYRQTSREIKRISSVTLSPIYAHFSETLHGVSTIRAMRHKQRFEDENRKWLDANQCAQFAGLAASQWLNIRLQMIGVAMVTGVAFIAVVEHHFKATNPGLVGLALSYALSVTSQLSGVVTTFTETEKEMVSVERACQYTDDVPQERHWAVLNAPSYWPIQGSIDFQQVFLKYRSNQQYALKNVTLETQPAEKIGIVGRTGSGKSSLFTVLFRLVELEAGQIRIDGINIEHIPLSELRSRLAIIPQDPFLFSGTIRENLDPTKVHGDGQMRSVLRCCHLWGAVERLGGLGVEVGERGAVLSVGQRQLLCLARALLTRAKILCIDEATASVDQETDKLIQETIRTQFRDQTVLTIAHRINTISDYDRILVMKEGGVSEFAPPQQLLRNPSSLYYSLVHGRRRQGEPPRGTPPRTENESEL